MIFLLVCFSAVVGLAIALVREQRRRRAAEAEKIAAWAQVLELLKAIHGDAPYFACPKCAIVSYNRNDLRQGYCGRCHGVTAKPRAYA